MATIRQQGCSCQRVQPEVLGMTQMWHAPARAHQACWSRVKGARVPLHSLLAVRAPHLLSICHEELHMGLWYQHTILGPFALPRAQARASPMLSGLRTRDSPP